MLTTLLRPTSGQATVAGFDLYRQTHEIRRSIGVALQEAGLDAMATGRELLKLQAQLFGMSPGQADTGATSCWSSWALSTPPTGRSRLIPAG